MAQQLVNQMTPEEQNNITFGYSPGNGCVGASGPVARLNFSGFCLSDSGNGVRNADLVTGFASGVSAAASWNPDLAYQRALYMGAEFKRKGTHVVNGPVVGPMGRTALDGRAWEGLGVDPYLSGKLVGPTVAGLQQSVISSVKHYVGNEQETRRSVSGGTAISEDMDDTTLHEYYLWPFQEAVRAGAGSVMCSYNRLNATYACSNDRTLKQILKGELAFPGFVLSDWNAQTDSLPSANAGLDMAMPSSTFWQDNALANATRTGGLSSGRLADMAQRIVAAWYHIFNGPAGNVPFGNGLPADLTAPHALVEARDPAGKASIRQSAIEGHVLLKNTNNTLPLKKPKVLSLFGYDATIAPVNNPASGPSSLFYVLGLQSFNLSFSDAALLLSGGLSNPPGSATLGTLISGGGSGATTASYWSDPYSAIADQAYEDDTFLYWDFQSTSPSVSAVSSACLVFINEAASEGYDRPHLADANSDTLVQNVANACANTVVVVHSPWIRLVDAWYDHPNVTGLLFAHLPGQESGRALADVLYARNGQGPSGRLPYTVAKSADDYGPLLGPCRPASSDQDPHCAFDEGTNVDYRYFLAHDITPRFPFGYGLTYSTFAYANLSAAWLVPNAPVDPPNPQVLLPGGITSLFDVLAIATATITNTGPVAAAEVAQLYVQFPGEPQVKVLRGFAKRTLQPRESAEVRFELTRRDLSRWNAASQQWALGRGSYGVGVGRDVLDIVANCTLVL